MNHIKHLLELEEAFFNDQIKEERLMEDFPTYTAPGDFNDFEEMCDIEDWPVAGLENPVDI